QVVLSGYIGGTMIALGMYAHRPALAFVTESTKLRAWGWLTYSVFMMSAVVLIVDRLFRLNTRKRFDAYRRASLEPGIEGEGRGLLPLLLTLLSLSAAV